MKNWQHSRAGLCGPVLCVWCPGEVEAASCQRRHVAGRVARGPAGVPKAMKVEGEGY